MTKWDEVKQRKWKHHVINRTGDSDEKNIYFEQWTQEDEQRVKGKGKEAKGKEGEDKAATDKEKGDKQQSGGDKGEEQAESPKGREGIDLWKAYWVANIKEELAKMHNNYSIRKVGR